MSSIYDCHCHICEPTVQTVPPKGYGAKASLAMLKASSNGIAMNYAAYAGEPTATTSSGTPISLDTLAYAKYSVDCLTATTVRVCDPNNKKDETMFNSVNDLEIQQRNFLKIRIDAIEVTKRAEARKAFNIDYRFIPANKDEFLAALKTATIEDKYSYFSKDGANKYEYSVDSLMNAIKLTDGKTVVDRPAYDAAKQKLADAVRDLKDTATLAPLAEATAAFEAFKTATFH